MVSGSLDGIVRSLFSAAVDLLSNARESRAALHAGMLSGGHPVSSGLLLEVYEMHFTKHYKSALAPLKSRLVEQESVKTRVTASHAMLIRLHSVLFPRKTTCNIKPNFQ